MFFLVLLQQLVEEVRRFFVDCQWVVPSSKKGGIAVLTPHSSSSSTPTVGWNIVTSRRCLLTTRRIHLMFVPPMVLPLVYIL
jgi:hypothetical protein